MTKTERVNCWDVNGNPFADPQSVGRSEFYKEQVELARKGIEPSKRVEVVQIFITDPRNQTVFISRRSEEKDWNGGLFDKTVGGHLQHGDSVEETVAMEMMQEIAVPCFFPRSHKFVGTYKKLKRQMNVSALLRHVTTRDVILTKRFKTEDVKIANRAHLIFGAFAGATNTLDDEAMGVMRFSIPQLQRDLAERPHLYTQEMHFWIGEYGGLLAQFMDIFA